MSRTVKNLLIFGVAAGLVAALSGPRAQDDSGRLDETRTVLAKWIETQQIISKEKKDWQVGREVLEQRVSLLEGEIAGLEERLASAREGIGAADTKRSELVQENDALRRAAASLEGVIAQLESKSLALVSSLPDPIRERVKPLSRRIPSDPAATDLTLGQRFQNIVGVLNEVNKFNSAITIESEVRILADGSKAEVTALYLGLGAAYYVTNNRTAAGIGYPTPEGWEWKPANELADKVAKAIAILEDEDVPAYVPLPVEIQ